MGFHTGAIQLLTGLSYLLVGQMRVYLLLCYEVNDDKYLTVILRGRAGYELIYITNEAVGRVGYYQLISGKSEKNNC